MKRRVIVLACFVALGSVDYALAADDCLRECSGDTGCEIEVAECLIGAGRAREAIKRLKPLTGGEDVNSAYLRMLAKAYLADGNQFWAQRTLQRAIDRDEADCASRSFLAWVHISQGDLDLAAQALGHESCPGPGPLAARWKVLEAFIARTEEKHEVAAAAVEQVEDAGEIYPEDNSLWLNLRRSETPGFIEPLSLRLELWGGYTSNAEAGSPADQSTSGMESAFGRFDLFSNFVMPLTGPIRPALEGEIKGHGIDEDIPRKLSYMELRLRPAVIIGRDFRVLIGYRADILLINQDEKSPFYEGHRGEVELEAGPILVFSGFGRRIFRERGRTRWEFDAGLGGSLSLHRKLRLLLAGSFRYYDARTDPYDQIGGTGILVFRANIAAGFSARVGVTLSVDSYLNSGGERGEVAFGIEDKRLDIITKPSVEFWSPDLWGGLRVALGYEFSKRWSTADNEGDNYAYLEHRVLLKMRWSFDWNPWAPEVVDPEGRVAMDYGLGAQADDILDQERIQDLLRQDEAARRGSSCVD